MRKKYFTDEERKKSLTELHQNWRNTPYGRATYLITDYRNMDEKCGFDKKQCNLTPQWLVDNVLSKQCVYCGKTGWKIIGCNRLDNSKPHTMDNVEPCCMKCNVELINPQKPLDQINPINGEVINVFGSTMDARRNGFFHASCVAKGKRKQDKGYIFKFISM